MSLVLRNQAQRANRVDEDKVAHYELPHLDLCCLQILTIFGLVFKVLAFLRAHDMVGF